MAPSREEERMTDIDDVRALERFIASQGTPEHLLTFQGILSAHEKLYAQEKPNLLCSTCGKEIVLCVTGDHWHHKDVPVDSHFPTQEKLLEYGWTWASEWDPESLTPRKTMPQEDWQEWVADIERKIAPVTVWARPLGLMDDWKQVER